MALHTLLGPPVVAVCLTSAAAFGVFRVLGSFVADDESDVGPVRRSVRFGLPVTFLVAYLVLGAAGTSALVDAVLGWIAPSLPGSRLDWTASQVLRGTGSAVVAVAGYVGLYPAVLRVRNVEMTTATAARRLFRYVVVLVVFVVVASQSVFIVATGPWWLTAAAVVVGMVGFLGLSPSIVRLVHPTRAPTTHERERISALAADVDAAFHAVHVLELADAETAWIDVQGFPGRRHLFVSDYLLEQFDDEELRALLASAGERSRRYLFEVRLVPLFVVLGVVAGLFAASELRFWPVAVLVAVVAVGLSLFGSRRIVFATDAAVAERVGTDVFVGALRRFADLNDADYKYGWLGSFFAGAPSLPRRLGSLGADHPDCTRPVDLSTAETREGPADGVGHREAAGERAGRSTAGRSENAERDALTDIDPWGVPETTGSNHRGEEDERRRSE